MNSFLLSEADELRLRNLLADLVIPHPNLEQRKALEAILAKAKITRDESALESRVGFYDRITLVSPTDSRDFFNLEIVMPDEADIDHDRITVLMPICLATLGKRCGENVSWPAHGGTREMRIISVVKQELVAG
jgi:regulator of nucleoside diphosphate kinase